MESFAAACATGAVAAGAGRVGSTTMNDVPPAWHYPAASIVASATTGRANARIRLESLGARSIADQPVQWVLRFLCLRLLGGLSSNRYVCRTLPLSPSGFVRPLRRPPGPVSKLALARMSQGCNTEPYGSVFIRRSTPSSRAVADADAARDPRAPRADATRRSPSSPTQFDMTLTGMKKHVQLLEDAGLVTTREGRPRAHLPARPAPPRRRSRLDREVPADAGSPPRPPRGIPRAHQRRQTMTATADQQSTHAPQSPRRATARSASSASSMRRAIASGARSPTPRSSRSGGDAATSSSSRSMELERGGHWRFVEHAPDGSARLRGPLPRSRRRRSGSCAPSSGTACPGHVDPRDR